MATKKLLQAYTFKGKTYGPGETEVPKDFPDVGEAEAKFKARESAANAPAPDADDKSSLTRANLGVRTNAVEKDGSFVPLRNGVEVAGAQGGVPAGNLSAEDLESYDKADLEDMAAQRGITVTRSKGDGEPTKADYVKALSGAQ